MRWKDLTVEQFQDIYKVINSTQEALDKKIAILSIITGRPVSFYTAMDLDLLLVEMKKLSFMDEPPKIDLPKKYFKVGTRYFRVQTNLHKFNADKFSAITYYSNGEENTINNLNILCAVVCDEVGLFGVKNTPLVERSKILKDMSYEQANNVTAFFLATLKMLPRSIQTYLSNLILKEEMRLRREVRRLKNTGAG